MCREIFLSNYRREDSKHPAGRLYDRLLTEFDLDTIFIDIDNIDAGADFVDALNDQVSQCDVMLSIIGPHWVDIQDPVTELRRLDNPDDFVRIEIESALSRNIHIIPVLVDDATMPGEPCLPVSLKPLSRRNAVRLTHERFHVDSIGLVAGIKTALAKLSWRNRPKKNKKTCSAKPN